MKRIEIFISCKYDYKSDTGIWIYYLNYNRAVIKRSGYINHAGSPNRTLLASLYFALQQVTEPCCITVHSKAALGFKNPKQSKNKDWIIKIQTLITKAGHIVIFDTTDDFGRVNIWEQVYGTKCDGSKTKLNNNAQPDIRNKKSLNDIFEYEPSEKELNEMAEKQKYEGGNWREMYSDLMCESNGAWVPGSGGY